MVISVLSVQSLLLSEGVAMFSADCPSSFPSGMEPGQDHFPSPPSKYDVWREGRIRKKLDSKALHYTFLKDLVLRMQEDGYAFETELRGDGVTILLEVRGFRESVDPSNPFHKGKPKVTPERVALRILRIDGDCPPHVQRWGGWISQPHLLGWWNGRSESQDRVAKYFRTLLPRVSSVGEFYIA